MNFEIAPKESDIQLTWDEAHVWCWLLNVGGKIGWRMPTRYELREIYEAENDFRKHLYWSSTERDDTCAWTHHYYNGNQRYSEKNYHYYVRAIRDLS